MSLLLGPCADMYAVTPNDGGDIGEAMGMPGMTYADPLNRPFDRLWIGSIGNVAIKTHNGNTVTISNLPVGVVNIGGKRVMNTNTTAGSLVAIIDNLV